MVLVVMALFMLHLIQLYQPMLYSAVNNFEECWSVEIDVKAATFDISQVN